MWIFRVEELGACNTFLARDLVDGFETFALRKRTFDPGLNASIVVESVCLGLLLLLPFCGVCVDLYVGWMNV